MASELKEFILEDLGRIVTGKTPKTSVKENFGNDFPFVTPRDLNGSRLITITERYLSSIGALTIKNSIIPKNSILVSCIGSDMGKTAVANLECVTNQQINALIVSEDYDYKYIYYNLNLRKDEIRGMAGGSAQPILNKSDFGKIRIQLPSLKSQRKISSFLSYFDDKIELNRQMNETLESMAQALFKSWFVDFDPVIDNALAAGNPIPDALKAKAAQRAEQLKAAAQRGEARSAHRELFPAEFTYTEELGWITKGWIASDVNDELQVSGGGTPSTKNLEFWESGSVSWTTPKDLSGAEAKVILETDRKITELGLTKISSGLLPIDTVLMSSRAPVGYLALTKIPLAINQGYIAINCEKTLTPEFVIQWADFYMDDIKALAGGTTFAEISKKSFKTMPILIPSKKIVRSYTNYIETIYNQITSNLESSKTLTQLRDTLLPKLLSGELRIANAATLVEGV